MLAKHRILENMELTVGTICTWIDTRFVTGFANSINVLVGKYASEPSSGPYKLLIHTLTKTNIKKKLLVIIYSFYCSYYSHWYLIRTSYYDTVVLLQQRLPSRVLPDQMDRYGEMRIIIYPDTDLWSIYSTSEKDGRLVMDGWKDLLCLYKLSIGDKMLLLIHHGGDEVLLFITPMPAGTEYFVQPDEE
jgi:hypothetical protein